jgi:hypothetical protein
MDLYQSNAHQGFGMVSHTPSPQGGYGHVTSPMLFGSHGSYTQGVGYSEPYYGEQPAVAGPSRLAGEPLPGGIVFSRRKIIVKNLSTRVASSTVKEKIRKQAGPRHEDMIDTFHFPRNHKGERRPECEVDCYSPEHAEHLAKLVNGIKLDGHVLKAIVAKEGVVDAGLYVQRSHRNEKRSHGEHKDKEKVRDHVTLFFHHVPARLTPISMMASSRTRRSIRRKRRTRRSRRSERQ